MKILRIVYDFADENNTTLGLAPALYELSLAQSLLNTKVYVLCGNLNKKNLFAGKFFYKLNKYLTVINLPRGLPHFGPFLTTSIAVLPLYFYFKFIKQINIVHLHQHLGIWLLLYKYLFGFLDKTPFVGHYHVTAKGREQNLLKNGEKLPFFTKYFEYPLHKFSDLLMSKVSSHIFCVSQNVKNELIEFYKINADRITVIESAISVTRFFDNNKIIDLNFEDNSTILGYVGRISYRKGIVKIINVLSRLPKNYKFVMWGEYQDDKVKLNIEKQIENLNLKNRVKYMGKISYFNNQSAFKSINIFLLPSSYEGLPKVVLEALASGCMVIASGFKLIKHIPNLILQNSLSEDSLLLSINKLKNAPSKYDSTKDVLLKDYSYESRALKIQQIYKLLLNNE